MKNNKIFKYLTCPNCKAGICLSDDEKTLFCHGERRHCFDLSSNGYANFALNRGVTGDSKAAVRSRSDFLNKGYYKPIVDALCRILKREKTQGFVIDAGCGEGYYTKRISDEGYEVLGLDLSKFAVHSTASRLQSKNNDGVFSCVSSIYEMPVFDGCADAVVSIFAPCAEVETSRVLSDDGIVVVVSAGPEHLWGLKKVLYDTAYKNENRADMPKGMALISEESISYSIVLESNEDVLNLFSMTPYYWRTSPSDTEKLRNVNALKTKVDIKFSVYKKEK